MHTNGILWLKRDQIVSSSALRNFYGISRRAASLHPNCSNDGRFIGPGTGTSNPSVQLSLTHGQECLRTSGLSLARRFLSRERPFRKDNRTCPGSGTRRKTTVQLSLTHGQECLRTSGLSLARRFLSRERPLRKDNRTCPGSGTRRKTIGVTADAMPLTGLAL